MRALGSVVLAFGLACTKPVYFNVPRAGTPGLPSESCSERCRADARGDDYVPCLRRCGVEPEDSCVDSLARECVRSQEFTTTSKAIAIVVGLAVSAAIGYGIYKLAKGCEVGSFGSVDC